MEKVTVIIPNYNTEGYIENCIKSVLNQTYQDFEIIMVDDCSTDNSLQIVSEINDSRIRIYRNETNSGPSYSRNKAIQLATGTYIAILDSDDWWEPNRLESMVGFAREKGADMVFDNLLYIRDNEDTPWTTYYDIKDIKVEEPILVNPEFFIIHDLGILKGLIRREILVKNNIYYNQNIKYGEDYLFYLEILRITDKVWLLPIATYYYLSREGSLIRNMYELAKQCIASTDELLTYPEYSSNRIIKEALLERKKEFTTIVTFYETENYIKRGKLVKAFKIFVDNPKIFKMMIVINLRKVKQKIMNNMIYSDA